MIVAMTEPGMIRSGAAHAAFQRLADEALFVRYGTDCWGYAMLAAGYIDVVVESDIKPWDVAAGNGDHFRGWWHCQRLGRMPAGIQRNRPRRRRSGPAFGARRSLSEYRRLAARQPGRGLAAGRVHVAARAPTDLVPDRRGLAPRPSLFYETAIRGERMPETTGAGTPGRAAARRAKRRYRAGARRSTDPVKGGQAVDL